MDAPITVIIGIKLPFPVPSLIWEATRCLILNTFSNFEPHMALIAFLQPANKAISESNCCANFDKNKACYFSAESSFIAPYPVVLITLFLCMTPDNNRISYMDRQVNRELEEGEGGNGWIKRD